MKKSNGASSLTDAIEKLEAAGQSKTQEFKQILEKDYEEIRRALEEVKPHLENLKTQVEGQFKEQKNKVETKVKENPWMVLGVVGLIALVIGWIIGQSKKD